MANLFKGHRLGKSGQHAGENSEKTGASVVRGCRGRKVLPVISPIARSSHIQKIILVWCLRRGTICCAHAFPIAFYLA